MSEQTIVPSGGGAASPYTQTPMSRQKKQQLYFLEQKFNQFDRDRSGAIDKQELQALCARLGAPLTSSEAERTMKQLDVDQSGFIEKDEFLSWWGNNPGLIGSDGMGAALGKKFSDLDKKLTSIALTGTASSLQTHLSDLNDSLEKVSVAILRDEERKAEWQKTAQKTQDLILQKNIVVKALKAELATLEAASTDIQNAYLQIVDSAKFLVKVSQSHLKPVEDVVRDTIRAAAAQKKRSAAENSFSNDGDDEDDDDEEE